MSIAERLGILSDEIAPGLDEALDWIAARGLRWVELRSVDGRSVSHLPDADVEAIAAEVRRRGLGVAALASPLFKCALDRARPVAAGDTFGADDADLATHLDRLPRTLAVARALGTRRVRIFSGWRERDPAAHTGEVVALLRRACDEAARAEVTLLLENEPACNAGTAAETAAIVRRVDHPALRLLWDPGNEAHAGGRAFPDGHGEVRGLVGHVHLKDAVGGAARRWLPAGAGHANLPAQLRALEADGYDGLYVIETHYVPDGGTKRAGSEETLARLRGIIEAL